MELKMKQSSQINIKDRNILFWLENSQNVQRYLKNSFKVWYSVSNTVQMFKAIRIIDYQFKNSLNKIKPRVQATNLNIFIMFE